MLQSLLVQPLLVQILEPCPQLTSILPLSASLISVSLQKPLLSCISKAGVEQDKLLNSTLSENGKLLSNIFTDEFNGEQYTFNMNEQTPLLNNKDSNNINSNNHYNDQNNNKNSSKINDLKREISLIDENYNSDYINANVNPVDNLDILSLTVLKEWTQRSTEDKTISMWKVYEFGKYRLYMGEVNKDYSLLLCAKKDYPSAIAIARLTRMCEIVSKRL